MNITKDSRIVEVFSADLKKQAVEKNELKDAHEYIKELASNPTPNNRYEIAQILSYVINDGLTERVNYIEQIADVKRTGYGEKAQFKVDIDDLKAVFQAKSSTVERSKVSSKYITMDTDEVSIRPVINFLDMVTGKQDLVSIARKATVQMELAIVKRIQDAVYAAFSALSSPNYASGAGVVASAFDPILNAMLRVGGSAAILGDIEALSKFTDLTGTTVAEKYLVEANENGYIGTYKGGKLIKLMNPFEANSLTNTVLRKDLIYVVPTGAEELRPIKVQFEGDVHTIDAPVNINSKEVEFRFDQYVGVTAVGVRKLMGVYEDTTL
jgi:hypothetical protein